MWFWRLGFILKDGEHSQQESQSVRVESVPSHLLLLWKSCYKSIHGDKFLLDIQVRRLEKQGKQKPKLVNKCTAMCEVLAYWRLERRIRVQADLASRDNMNAGEVETTGFWTPPARNCLVMWLVGCLQRTPEMCTNPVHHDCESACSPNRFKQLDKEIFTYTFT